MKFIIKRILSFLAVALIVIAGGAQVFAADDDFYSGNDILWYDKDVCPTYAEGDSEAGTKTAGLSDAQADFVDKYHSIAEQLSIKYGIPWETVMAQGILESAAGTSNFAKTRNNFFGIGAFDSNPGAAKSYSSPTAGWEGYYKNIVNTSVYRDNGVFKAPTITDPVAYLKAIEKAGYASSSTYVEDVSKLVTAVEARAAQMNWDLSPALAQKHPEMFTNAAKYARAGATSDTADDSSSNGACLPSGSITEVANTMGAWGDAYNACYIWGGGHGSTSEIKDAIDHHFQGAYGVDCSGFVRAVIYQATGVDPGSHTTSTMCSDTANFEHVPRDKAQPGDFAISCGEHVEVITAVANGTFTTVGSHTTGCGAGNGASPSSYQGTENFVLRYVGKGASV
jgi:cell wall-associated NlpC family hydrolase